MAASVVLKYLSISQENSNGGLIDYLFDKYDWIK